jgi:hypothetical protein
MRAAVFHVIADAAVSVSVIVDLLLARVFGWLRVCQSIAGRHQPSQASNCASETRVDFLEKGLIVVYSAWLHRCRDYSYQCPV